MTEPREIHRKRAKGKLAAGILMPIALVVAAVALWPFALEEWQLQRLDSTDEAVRRAAAATLAEMGAVRAIPKLVKILKERGAFLPLDLRFRFLLSRARWTSGGSASQVGLPMEGMRVVDDNPRVVKSLPFEEETRAGSKPEVSLLPVELPTVEADEDTDSLFVEVNDSTHVVEECRNALNKLLLPRPAAYITPLVWDDSPGVARWAVFTLGKLGVHTRSVLEAIVGSLKSPYRELRLAAVEAIAGFGPQAVPALVDALKDGDARVKREAARRLAEVGLNPAPAMLVLKSCFANGDALLRTQCLVTFAGLGVDFVPFLVERLADPDPDVRSWAASKLKEMGPDAAPAVSALIAALEDRETSVVYYALDALGAIGPAASPALPALMRFLRSGSALSQDFGRSLARIGPAAVPFIVDGLKDADTFSRLVLFYAAGLIGPDAKAVVPALTKALDEPNIHLREVAATALREIGPDARDTTPSLVRAIGAAEAELHAIAAGANAEVSPTSYLQRWREWIDSHSSDVGAPRSTIRRSWR